MTTKYATTQWIDYFYDLAQGNTYCRLFYKIGAGGEEQPAITGQAIDGTPDENGNYVGPNTAVEVEEGSGLYLYNGSFSWTIPESLIDEDAVYLVIRDKTENDIDSLEYGPFDIRELISSGTTPTIELIYKARRRRK